MDGLGQHGDEALSQAWRTDQGDEQLALNAAMITVFELSLFHCSYPCRAVCFFCRKAILFRRLSINGNGKV
jgi:hypothetical protein